MRRKSYAVWWQEGLKERHAGRLQLGGLHLLLSNGSTRLAIPLDTIVAVDYRGGELYVRRQEGPEVRIGNLDGVGVLLELSDGLAAHPAQRLRPAQTT